MGINVGRPDPALGGEARRTWPWRRLDLQAVINAVEEQALLDLSGSKDRISDEGSRTEADQRIRIPVQGPPTRKPNRGAETASSLG